MDSMHTLLGLLPPVSYARNGIRVRNQAQVDANALDSTIASANLSANAIDPRRSGELLSDWERVLGLSPATTVSRRVSAVMAKLNEIGGLSIPYFTNLAAALGYQITITEPQPFRAGVNRAGDRIAREDIMWVWWVNISQADNQIVRFRAGQSAAGERISDFGDSEIEQIFNDLKPAHTDIRFTYED